jgi:phosphopantothenate synthetase
VAEFAWSSGLDAGAPVARSAAVVGNGEDMDYIISEQIHDVVGKAAYAQASKLKLLANSRDQRT